MNDVTELLYQYKDSWYDATHHAFLEAVRNGELAERSFATWLVQDYYFVRQEFTSIALILAHAPRYAQKILVTALNALEAELSWFETHAEQRNLKLDAPQHKVTQAYGAFLASLAQKPLDVALTGLWAAERAYLESWQNIAPGHVAYQAYIEHWANPDFEQFVAEFAATANRALAEEQHTEEAEAAFQQVAQLEKDFWDMAWSGAEQ